MSQTIKARLRELVKQQEADFTVTADAGQDAMDVDSAGGGEEDKMVAVLKGKLVFGNGFLDRVCLVE